MSRNIKGLYTELAFEAGTALVDESIVREQLRQKRLKRQRARKKARRRALRRRIILLFLVITRFGTVFPYPAVTMNCLSAMRD